MENVREKIEKEGINEFINSLFEKYKPTNTNELFNVFKDMADALANDLNEAIDKEAQLTDNKFVTSERNVQSVKEELNYDEIIKTINETLNSIVNAHSEEEFKEVYQPKIVQITERYLGKGKKISMASRDQVEQLKLISEDLKEV